MNDLETFGRSVSSFVAAIVGLAIIAVVLSNGAQTVNVIKTFFAGLTGLLSVVISPVTGGSTPVGGTGTGVNSQPSAASVLNTVNQNLSGLTSIGKAFSNLSSLPSTGSGSGSNFVDNSGWTTPDIGSSASGLVDNSGWTDAIGGY